MNENDMNLTTNPAVNTSPDVAQENKTLTAISPLDTDQGNQEVPEIYDGEEPKSASVSSRPPLGEKAVRP